MLDFRAYSPDVTRNPYETLGVAPTATDEEIRKAFKRIASETHPDKNPGDTVKEAQFKEANSAYQLIGDPEKRAAYATSSVDPFEKFRQAANRASSGRRVNINIEDIFSGVGSERWGDVFRQAQVEATNRRAQRGNIPPQAPVETESKGDDITMELRLTLAEAVYGAKKKIRTRSPRPAAPCSSCKGSGAEPGTRRVTCSACSGSGKTIGFNGTGTRTSACAACRGRGSMALTPCRQCSGHGKMVHEAEIMVTVPAGIAEGQQLRLAGHGAPGSPPGSLYLNIEIDGHPSFVRKARDLYTVTPISWVTAIRGGVINIKALNGEDQPLEVPAGIQSGATLVARGCGVRSTMGGTDGHLYVQIHVDMPKNLTPRAQKLLDELVEEISRK